MIMNKISPRAEKNAMIIVMRARIALSRKILIFLLLSGPLLGQFFVPDYIIFKIPRFNDKPNSKKPHLASGIYFYRVEAGDKSAVKKMVYLK